MVEAGSYHGGDIVDIDTGRPATEWKEFGAFVVTDKVKGGSRRGLSNLFDRIGRNGVSFVRAYARDFPFLLFPVPGHRGKEKQLSLSNDDGCKV